MDVMKCAIEIAKSNSEEKLNHFVHLITKTSTRSQIHYSNQIFKAFDSALDEEKKTPLLATLLTIVLEIAQYHQKSSDLNPEKNQILDSITSHLLARSNTSHDSVRLAIAIFFSKIVTHEKHNKKRILERFGENLLKFVFNIYSEDKKRSPIALQFLVEHLEIFLTTSSELAAMTNHFFQNFMFKSNANFVIFMDEYKNYLLQKEIFAPFFIIHSSFLIRQSLDFDHEILSFNLLKILIQYLSKFDDQFQQEGYQLLINIMLNSKTLKGREIAMYLEKEFKNEKRISFKLLAKQFSVTTPPQICQQSKKKKRLENLSFYKKLLILVSDN